jgi:hypothetical protein
MLIAVGSGCSGGGGAASAPSSEHHARQAGAARVGAAVGQALPTRQRALTARTGPPRNDTSSTITVIDATRSLGNTTSGVLLRVKDIGVLRVTCSARPHAQFRLTHFAAGEGPPVIRHTSTPANGRTSIHGAIMSWGGLTGKLGTMTIPEPHPTHQVLDRYDLFGGGEAFQFAVSIAALITPTTSRCDLLAEATVVTHGPFYRDAPR